MRTYQFVSSFDGSRVVEFRATSALWAFRTFLSQMGDWTTAADVAMFCGGRVAAVLNNNGQGYFSITVLEGEPRPLALAR